MCASERREVGVHRSKEKEEVMLAKVSLLLAPVVFLAVAATPAPNEWHFIRSACLGGIAGAAARVSIALFAESVQRMMLGVYLAGASFWIGVIGALLAYLFKAINGHDTLQITAVAAGVSLFGLLFEVLVVGVLKARAKAMTRAITKEESL